MIKLTVATVIIISYYAYFHVFHHFVFHDGYFLNSYLIKVVTTSPVNGFLKY